MGEGRRPAGPEAVLCEVSKPSAVADARAIGRRVAAKVLALAVADTTSEPSGVSGAQRGIVVEGLELAEIVEAEVLSSAAAVPLGTVDVRLGFLEALHVAARLGAGAHLPVTATERAIFAELRWKFLVALGLVDS